MSWKEKFTPQCRYKNKYTITYIHTHIHRVHNSTEYSDITDPRDGHVNYVIQPSY